MHCEPEGGNQFECLKLWLFNWFDDVMELFFPTPDIT